MLAIVFGVDIKVAMLCFDKSLWILGNQACSFRQLWQRLHRRRPQQLSKRRGMRLTLPRLNKSDREFR